MATFPSAGANPLGIKVELLSIVTAGSGPTSPQYVLLRNPVQISGMGRTDWTSTLQAATLTLTLRNDGRFTPKLAAGAYFPNITRNVQIRVVVNATSVTAVAYSGFRFWGEVAEWPPALDAGRPERLRRHHRERDLAAHVAAPDDPRVRVHPVQRDHPDRDAASPARTGRWKTAPAPGSSSPYDSVAGTANAIQSFVTGAAGLSLAACTDFKGSDGIPQLNAAKITATVPAGGTATNNVTRFLISVPANGDSASRHHQLEPRRDQQRRDDRQVRGVPQRHGHAADAAAELRRRPSSRSGTTTTNVKGVPVLVSCELTPSGGNVAFAFRHHHAGRGRASPSR